MYNIVIFSGGTGSIALQEGFSAIYGNCNYNLDIIINAYDNGKSTGICRKVFDSKILGPSDLRKNQMTQFRLQYAAKLKDTASREFAIYKIFGLRLDAKSKEEYYAKASSILENAKSSIGNEDFFYLKGLIDFFFFEDIQNGKWRITIQDIEFKDFSLANILYSSVAAMNDYSLSAAGKCMASFLRIKDNVHLISDVNLYLQARTESGYIIPNEEDIVRWNNENDKIVAVTLFKDENEYIPSVDEGKDLSVTRNTRDIIEAADIIIFSSGTQWSSLIPTYMHSGLRKIFAMSKAKKYVVMNNIEDHDMKGVCADDIVKILGKYIPMNDVTSVVNLDAITSMNHVNNGRCISGHISGNDNGKHNPIGLVNLIMRDYLGVSGSNGRFIFDLDGTLWDERETNRGKAVGTENINLFEGIILSGNSYEHVRDVFKYLYHKDKVVQIYSDFGNVHFTSEDYNINLLSKDYVIAATVVNELEKVEEFKGKIRTRGAGCVVTIKPLMNREVLLRKVQECLSIYNGQYIAYISGHTSIDVMHRDYNKKTMLREIINREDLKIDQIIFIGNEVKEGAEVNISELGVRTIQVDDVYECNVLLRTLYNNKTLYEEEHL